MGKFSEQFKLSKRIRQADFGRKETREYWMAWANGVIDRATYKSGDSTYVTEEAVDEFSEVQEEIINRSDSFWATGDEADDIIVDSSRVDKFEVKQEDQVLEVGSFEEAINDEK